MVDFEKSLGIMTIEESKLNSFERELKVIPIELQRPTYKEFLNHATLNREFKKKHMIDLNFFSSFK